MTVHRAGFALLTVLWVMVAASVVALTGSLAARNHVGIASNRVDAERAAWRTNDCLSRARAAADEALAQGQREDAVLRVWRALGRETLASPLITGCDVRVESAGSRLDVNAADARQLVALFRAIDLPEPEMLADRLIDWRDEDDEPRTNGAETAWYALQQRPGPRNGPLGDVRELRRVAGFETVSGLDDLLGVEKGRLCINTASWRALAAVPGFTDEVLSRIDVIRQSGRQIGDILTVAASVSSPSRDSIMTHFGEISELVTLNPEAWIVTVRATAGAPGTRQLTAFADVRLILGNGHAVVTRRRSWL